MSLERRLTVEAQSWPIAGAFVISRGAKTEAKVVYVEIEQAGSIGRGEATPYARYGETLEGTVAAIESVRAAILAGADRAQLQTLLPAGAARNALDCALWDLEAKRTGVPVFTRAGLDTPYPVKTAYTISLGPPEVMAAAAAKAAQRPWLKLKIGSADDIDAIAAVRAAAPRTRLIVDANEALRFDDLTRLAPEFERLEVKAIEQPLPAGADDELAGYQGAVPLCADESLHTRGDLPRIASLYQMVNIKLDKTGGLTEALALRAEAGARDLMIMAGCMVATSLSMAPALLIAKGAQIVDLDGPLLLAKDREPGLSYVGSMIEPAPAALWG